MADQQREHRGEEHEHHGLHEADQQLHEIERNRQQPAEARHERRHGFQHVLAGEHVAVESKTERNGAEQDRDDFEQAGEINFSRGYIFKHVNLAFGGFGMLGDYENSAIDPGQPNYFNTKYFGALGGRVSANLFFNSESERSEYRYLGIEAAYSHEFGNYATFRQSIANEPGYYVDPRTDLFTAGLTTEILVSSQNKMIQQSFRLFFGSTFGYNSLYDSYYNNKNVSTNTFPQLLNLGFINVYPKASYYIKFKDYFGTAEIGGGIFLRFGRIF